jgi:hypothetical protein
MLTARILTVRVALIVTMIESRLLSRLATATSVIGHVAALLLILLFAGVRPFQTDSAKAITVDLVTPDEIKPPEQNLTPPPETTLPKLDTADQAAKPAEPPPSQATPPAEPAATEPPPAASQPEPPQQLAAAPPVQSPPHQPPPPPAFTPPEPDVTVKYGVMLGLPDAKGNSDFDDSALQGAKLSAADIAAFRRHLKTCSPMPDNVSTSDDLWIKLRAAFTPDGRLATAPILIEGKASPKALALAKGAIAALQACQPYAMLPADKYNEWKMLDLEFSPRDFNRG